MKLSLTFLTASLAVLGSAEAAPSFTRGLVRGETAPRQRSLKKSDDVPSARDCDLDEKDDEVEFECKAKTQDESSEMEIKDEIDYKVKKSDEKGVVIKVKYEQEMEQDEEDIEVESETEYEVVFDRLIEFVSGSATVGPAYDFENDEVLQTLSLRDFGDFTSVTNDGEFLSFSLSTTDNVVTFTFTINLASEGEGVTANEMKIDVLIENFPWIRDDTYLALVASIETERSVEVEDEGDGEPEDVLIRFSDALKASSYGFVPFGSFTWANTADATYSANVTDANMTMTDANMTMTDANMTDANVTEVEETETIEVIASQPKAGESVDMELAADAEQETKTVEVIAFSFVGAAAQGSPSIFWDPEAGIGYASGSGAAGVTLFFTTAFGAIASLFLLAM